MQTTTIYVYGCIHIYVYKLKPNNRFMKRKKPNNPNAKTHTIKQVHAITVGSIGSSSAVFASLINFAVCYCISNSLLIHPNSALILISLSNKVLV